MKTRMSRKSLLFCGLVASCMLGVSSARATFVTWNLNPNGLSGDVGSNQLTLTQSGYSITAYGYTVGSPNTPLGLHFKNDGLDETGLGVVGTSHNELEGANGQSLQFLTLDVSSLISSGFSTGKLQIGSVQQASNDKFQIFGSNTLGVLGTPLTSSLDYTKDLTWVNIPKFGTYNYISIAANWGDVLPYTFQSMLCVPELSALFPVVGLISAVFLTQLLRRRRMMQLRSTWPQA